MRIKAAAVLMMVLLQAAGARASSETVLYNFTGGSDGAYPINYGGLGGSNFGYFFGTTVYGAGSYGTVFAITGSSLTTEYSFTGGSDGAYPHASAIFDGISVWGTTSAGGSGNSGTVFVDNTGGEQILYSFSGGSDGAQPYAPIILDTKGNAYGTTANGGASGAGVVYEISAGVFSVLYSFTGGSDGSNPYGGLAVDSKGNLYGTTYLGGAFGQGTVFQLSNSGGSWKETVLHSFAGGSNDGAYPLYGSLTLAKRTIKKKKQQVIFGVTQSGGTASIGTAFEMVKAKTGYKLIVLHSFAGADGAYPYGTLTYRKGKLFGTTDSGGASGYGTVFELAQANGVWTETLLHSFAGGTGDGEYPTSGLAPDSSGNLYGVTYQGGSSGVGTFYEVTP